MRLNERSIKLPEQLGEKPIASIPTACNGWAEAQTAYRFFGQQGIGWEDILAPHFICTHERMRDRSGVLSIQDKTKLNINGQDISGSGKRFHRFDGGSHRVGYAGELVDPLGTPSQTGWQQDKLWEGFEEWHVLGELRFTLPARQ